MGSWDLAIALDRSNPEPLYLQLVKAIEEGIRHGRFKPGDALPGTRAMAELLGVNRNTSLAAYKELEAEGWIEVAPDRGTFVARTLPFILETPAGISAQDSASWKRATPRSEPFFQPGAPALASFQLIPDTPDLRLAPTDAIHRAYGRVLKLHPERLLQPGWDPRGMLDLRNSLGKMLREMRGLSIEAGNLLLTRGLMSTLTCGASARSPKSGGRPWWIASSSTCIRCHGPDGSGRSPDGKKLGGLDFTQTARGFRALSGPASEREARAMIRTIQKGIFFGLTMPSWKDRLSQEDSALMVREILLKAEAGKPIGSEPESASK